MSNKENRHEPGDLAQFQCLPLKAKIRMSTVRIEAWYESWTRFEIENIKTGKTRFVTMDTREFGAEPELKENEWIKSAFSGAVYVSFSGGKDSTVLADICARVCQRYGYTLYLLFVNTGLEYPEIQKFVKTYAEWLRTTYEIEVVLDIVRPEMRFDEVIKKYGYPVISKEVAQKVHDVNTAKKSGYKDSYALRQFNGTYVSKNGKKNAFSLERWKFILDADFDISHMCCNVMKKKPSKIYEKETGRKVIIGTLASESKLRKQQWLINGCNAFDKGRPSSQPLSFWTEQDILHYIKKYDVPYCPVYGDIVVDLDTGEIDFGDQMNIIDYLGCYEPEDKLKTTGCDRTGCIFCMFGCHLEKEPNRFQRLKETYPRQYQYCIGGGEMVNGKWQPSKEGLGLGKVLDYIGVKYE